MSSEQQQLDTMIDEDACLLWWDSEGENKVLISLKFTACLQAIFRDLCVATCIVVPWWWWWSWWPACSSKPVMCLPDLILFKLLLNKYVFFPWYKRIAEKLLPHLNSAFVEKRVSTYVVSTNVADVVTTYDVTAGNDCTWREHAKTTCHMCQNNSCGSHTLRNNKASLNFVNW